MTENTRIDGNDSNTVISQEVQNMKTQINQFADLVQVLTKNDKSSGDSLHLLKENVKKLIYNQQVLENKLDDCLKNQFNTDQVVNDLNWKLSRLLQESSAMKRSFHAEEANMSNGSRKRVKMNGVTVKPKAKGSKHFDEIMDTKCTANNGYGVSPHSNHNQADSNDDNVSGAAASIVLLPNGQMQIPKSKKHFIDPTKNGKLLVSEHSLKKSSTATEDGKARAMKNSEPKTELNKFLDDTNKNLRRSSRRSTQNSVNATTNKGTEQEADERSNDLQTNSGITIVNEMENGKKELDQSQAGEEVLEEEEEEAEEADRHDLEAIKANTQEDQVGTYENDSPLSIKNSRLNIASKDEEDASESENEGQDIHGEKDKGGDQEKVEKDEKEPPLNKMQFGHDLHQSAKEMMELNRAKLQAIRDEEKNIRALKRNNQETLTRSSSISSSSSSSSNLSSSSKISLATTNTTEVSKTKDFSIKPAMKFKEMTPHSALIQNTVDIPSNKDMPLIDVNEEDNSESDADEDQEHENTKMGKAIGFLDRPEQDNDTKKVNEDGKAIELKVETDNDKQFRSRLGTGIENDKESDTSNKPVNSDHSEVKNLEKETTKEPGLSAHSKTDHNESNENFSSSDEFKDDSVYEKTESPPLQDFSIGDSWSASGLAQAFSKSSNSKQNSLLTGQLYYTGKPTLSDIEANVISQSNPLFHHQNEVDKLTGDLPLTLNEAVSALSEKQREKLASQRSSALSASTFLSFHVELKMVKGVYYRVDTGKVLTRDAFMEMKYRTSFYPKWNSSMDVPSPITMSKLMQVSQIVNGYRFYALSNATMQNINQATRNHKGDKLNEYMLDGTLEEELEETYEKLGQFPLTESFFNTLPYFLMEFRWENLLISRKFDVAESKRTWQRRKALFALLHAWREKTIEERTLYFGKDNNTFTLYHCVRELEAYRILLNKSVSWFYNHITMLRIILFELFYHHGNNLHKELQEKDLPKYKTGPDEFWREWMFPRHANLP